jgi:hypothetical protein
MNREICTIVVDGDPIGMGLIDQCKKEGKIEIAG